MEYIKAYNDNELIFEGTVPDFLISQDDGKDGYLAYIIENRTSNIIEEKDTINGNWKFVISTR